MSSCSDFEEVDIERFEEIIEESGGRHSSDSFAVLGSDDPDSFERASPSSESIEDLGHRVLENIDDFLKKEMTDLQEENLRLRDFVSVSIDETKLKMMDLQDQLENMTKSMEKSQETVVEKPLRKSKLKKTRPKSLFKKKKSHPKPLLKKKHEKKIDYQDLIDQLDENEAMLKSIERKLSASELEQKRIPQESSHQRAFMWFSSILAAVFASLAVFFAQYNVAHFSSQKFNENLIPKNECLHFILKQNLSEPLLSFRNSSIQETKFKPTKFQMAKIPEKTTQFSFKREAIKAEIKEENDEVDEEISTEITEYLLVESQIFEDELLESPCLPEINEDSFEETELDENQNGFEVIGDTANLFEKEKIIKEDKNFETPVFIDNDDDDYNEDIFFNDRMRLEYMQRMRLGNFYHRAYFHQPAFPNYSRGPMFSHPIGFALNFES
ncbi:Oidioi.mRNA.OKI2018_I69.PAR.g9700.t1.cds [Oikopleura dioica]|uniref:Oidioi.mRNA.OKI2018_I69.PAR.g9700.t1.cds n=1 Tax=Oikopleura dioica TaxID=34765 RepID=A0ABN7RQH1_OIKDI|nr:Oidioi.mRNA.OKI2018_I69.PAR.g9700.t1.cds [Oikopleura dioica]